MNKKYKWFQFFQEKEDAAYNFFCFPHAGAGASIYATWGKVVPKSFGFFPVQYPMRENRRAEPMPSDLKELAAQLAADHADLFQSKPCIFFGHCFGALVAYETAQVLRNQYHCDVRMLVPASAISPRKLEGTASLDAMSREELVEFFVNLGYITPEVAQNKMYTDFFIPALKTDYKLVYQYDPTMDSKLTSWIYAPYGHQDPNVSPEEIATWDTVTTGKVVLRAYDGGHFFLNDANLAVLFREVEEMVQDF